MKLEQSSNPKRIFTVTLSVILITMSVGYITAIKTAGGLFSDSSLAIRTVSFDDISFLDSFFRALRIHLLYTFCILMFSGRFPGAAIPGIYLIYRSFSLGVCVGLASAGCVFSKAAGICFSVFISNVLVFPLYIVMFFLSVTQHQRGHTAGEYFSFEAKTILLFAILCAAECVQTLLGTLVLNCMY